VSGRPTSCSELGGWRRAIESHAVDGPGELRETFDTVAELYHAARSRYPHELFDRLVAVTRLRPSARLLEIGPGTGQATVPLARRGFPITAVELGPNLAQVARRELAPYPNVDVVVGAFEDVALSPGAFELVYSATAFHWIRSDQQFARPHRLLTSGGHLAVLHTEHVSDEKGDAFFAASQPIYEKYIPTDPDQHYRPPRADELRPLAVDQKLFTLVYFEAFPVVANYSSRQYVELLGTYSNHLALPARSRRSLFAGIGDLIDSQFGGAVERHFAMTLTIARANRIDG
jgi:SAM-dependent methyltransferase